MGASVGLQVMLQSLCITVCTRLRSSWAALCSLLPYQFFDHLKPGSYKSNVQM